MSNEDANGSESSAENRFAVPNDFPWPTVPADGKCEMVEFQGVHYPAGSSPPELWVRWDTCDNLVMLLQWQCQNTKQGKSADLPEAEVLRQEYEWNQHFQWCSPEELKWIFRRVAQNLNWDLPEILEP